jgi:hypothetical protein
MDDGLDFAKARYGPDKLAPIHSAGGFVWRLTLAMSLVSRKNVLDIMVNGITFRPVQKMTRVESEQMVMSSASGSSSRKFFSIAGSRCGEPSVIVSSVEPVVLGLRGAGSSCDVGTIIRGSSFVSRSGIRAGFGSGVDDWWPEMSSDESNDTREGNRFGLLLQDGE